MMEHKRGPVSLEHSSMTSLTPKRLKADISISSKEKKEKFGERIAALQQLVSPFGKTDTASVLFEAMGYINFLHEQVKFPRRARTEIATSFETCGPYMRIPNNQGWKSLFNHNLRTENVLSAPYLHSTPASNAQESYTYNLRNKGLCLVPVSYTEGVAGSNGADIWAPIKTLPKF